jgi:DNA polymerase-3 subunit alpha
MSETRFVHLHLHSQYSLVDSMVDVDDLVAESARMGNPAVALTDHCNFYALIKFYKAALKAGVKPILGSDFLLANGEGEQYPFTLLAMNEQGYRNITQIISLAYLEGQKQGKPYVNRKWLAEYNDGVLALSGAQYGDIGRALLQENIALAKKRLQEWMALFPGRFYLELQRTGRPREEEYLRSVIPLAAGAGCPVVATNDVRFLSADAFEEHEIRVCIHDADTVSNPRRVSRYSPQQYLRSEAEMVVLFADIPSALENSVMIARRCSVKLKLGKYQLPDYPLPSEYGHLGHDVFFRNTAHNGLTQRLSFLFDAQSPDFPEKEKIYRARLDFELDTILKMGFSGYFLIVMEFIQWAKDNGIPVGPGRGSGAGSLVAYSLKITDLDPLAYDLLFERFLNPERVSMPDFDIDFCMMRRDEVIEHVKERYGNLAVSQIITFGTMAAKGVVRDVARATGLPVGLADRVAKMIPNHPDQMLRYALGQFRDEKEKEKYSALVSAELQDRYEGDEEIHDLIDKALKLEGVVRGVGKHAGGVVIAPGKLTDFAPLYCDQDGNGALSAGAAQLGHAR